MHEEKNEQTRDATGRKNGGPLPTGGAQELPGTTGPMARDAAGGAEQIESDPGGDGGDIPEGPVKLHYVYVMTSDVGIVKIGISGTPEKRLRDVIAMRPIIRRIHVAYGMDFKDAQLVEK